MATTAPVGLESASLIEGVWKLWRGYGLLVSFMACTGPVRKDAKFFGVFLVGLERPAPRKHIVF